MAQQKPYSCTGCPLEILGTGFGNPEGYGTSGVLLVGEALGEQEAASSLPFRPNAPAGAILERAIHSIGMTREDFGITNVVNCRPPNNALRGESYEIGAIDHCRQHLKQIQAYYRYPRVAVALGAIPTRALTGLSGAKLGIDMLRGFAIPAVPGILDNSLQCNTAVVPSFHPSYIARGEHALLLALQRDLRYAVELAKRLAPGVDVREALAYRPPYQLKATIFQLHDLYQYLKDNPSALLSFDFESVGSVRDDLLLEEPDEEDGKKKKKKKKAPINFWEQTINQVNFSLRPGHAIVCDYEPGTMGVVKDILCMTSNPKCGHNIYDFDLPCAIYNDMRIKGDRLDDTMLMFNHVYKDLAGGQSRKSSASSNDDGAFANLQFCASFYGFPLPWKHLAGDAPHLYGAYDADATLWVYNGVMQDMLGALQCYESYDLFVRQLRLELAAAERRGMPASRSSLKSLGTDLAADIKIVLERIQSVVPDDLKPTGPKKGIRSKSVLKQIDAEMEAHGPDSPWLRSEKITQRRIPLQNEMCECVKFVFDGSPDLTCDDCHGVGTLARGSKIIPCKCKGQPKLQSCGQHMSAGWIDGQPRAFINNLEACTWKDALPAAGELFHDFVSMCSASNYKHPKWIYICKNCGLHIPKAKLKICSCYKDSEPSCSECEGSGKRKIETSKPCNCTKRARPDLSCQKCNGTGLFTGIVNRYVRVMPFKPSAPKMLMAYAQAKGYSIPRNSKKKISMDKETIIKLEKSTGDPLFGLIKEAREWQKIKSSYVDSWLEKGFSASDPRVQKYLQECENDRDDSGDTGSVCLPGDSLLGSVQSNRVEPAGGEGLDDLVYVHTNFSFKPATGQLSSRNPNIQITPNESKARNNPRLAEVYGRFRSSIRPKPSHRLVELDMKSFHVLTLGYEAGDMDYIRLARLDAHSYLAANMLSLPGCRECLSLPDDELVAYLKYVKKNHEQVRNQKAKPAILGYGFGMGPRKLYDLNMDSFASEQEAEYTIDMLNGIFPKAAKYRQQIPLVAHKQKYLRSPFGCIRWFMNVMQRDQTGRWTHGKDWEKAIAFRPANIAFSVLKLAMLRLSGRDATGVQVGTNYNAKFGLVNQIHDALLFNCPNPLVEECIYIVKTELERPVSAVLDPNGSPFWCECETKVGTNWSEMKEVKS